VVTLVNMFVGVAAGVNVVRYSRAVGDAKSAVTVELVQRITKQVNSLMIDDMTICCILSPEVS